MMISVSGDQATVAKLCALKCHTSHAHSWFTSHRFILVLTELWHMKWAFIKGIFWTHWMATLAKGDFRLRYASDKLRQKVKASSNDYYTAD